MILTPGGVVRHLQLQRRRRRAAGQPAAARGGQRPARDARSDRGQDRSADIQAATAQTAASRALNNPLVQQYTWSMPTQSFNPSPTVRLDYEVTQNHRLTGSLNYRHINSTPDTTNSAQLPFPDSLQTGSQQSTRWTTSESLRSTFGDNLVNEFRVGGIGRRDAVLAGVRDRHVVGHQRLSPQLQRRVLRHRRRAHQLEPRRRPVVARGLDQGDREHDDLAEGQPQHVSSAGRWCRPTCGCRTRRWCRRRLRPARHRAGRRRSSTPTTLPGASAADITQAKNLYAMLTGRITSLDRRRAHQRRRRQYVPLGLSRAEGRMREFNFFVADSWRVTPEPDGQRRPALRAAESVLPDQQQLHDRDGGRRSTASRASATCSSPAR